MRIKWLKDVEFGEANFFAAGSHLISAAMALCALLSSEWILIESGESGGNSTQSNDISNDLSYQLSGSIDECTNIGCYDFWRSARFGGFRDKFDQPHVLFHSNDRVLLDCVTPVVANLFYILIALCFFMFMSSVVGCVMNIIPPAHGFLQWVRANSVTESANMILTLCTCITGFIAELEISSLRPDSDVTIGMGILFITIRYRIG
ncbi:hypothetical protein WR25_22221 isoform B [Diploscapter pachys]|uniref:Transmembrane protein 127 transmembrane region domain-containing protein n=1 Tax=Diploscapter pachys TaxID=2018661 RepID=A0A2A2KRX1_9BILA|nr:hypothetical protein WR25_22221 isoform B [Diploscapter pachys]